MLFLRNGEESCGPRAIHFEMSQIAAREKNVGTFEFAQGTEHIGEKAINTHTHKEKNRCESGSGNNLIMWYSGVSTQDPLDVKQRQ